MLELAFMNPLMPLCKKALLLGHKNSFLVKRLELFDLPLGKITFNSFFGETLWTALVLHHKLLKLFEFIQPFCFVHACFFVCKKMRKNRTKNFYVHSAIWSFLFRKYSIIRSNHAEHIVIFLLLESVMDYWETFFKEVMPKRGLSTGPASLKRVPQLESAPFRPVKPWNTHDMNQIIHFFLLTFW